MKQFLIRFLAFILLISMLFTCINIFQGKYNNAPSHYKLKYKALSNTSSRFDGIIIGSSHAAHSINPSLLNSSIPYYNFALNGASPKFYYNWYNELFVKPKRTPKHCIIGIDWFMFDSKWLWRNFEQDSEYFTSDLFNTLLYSQNDFNKTDLIENRLPFIKYRQQIKSSLQMQIGDKNYPANTFSKGYIAYELPFDSLKYVTSLREKIDTIQVDYFKKLIAQMVSDNVEIIFVATPEYNIDPEKYKGLKSLAIINQIAKKYNIPILNFNTTLRSPINANIHYFSDWEHLNGKGAKVFSIYLSNELNKLPKTNNQ